jgi:hypothetical protein
MPRKKHSTPEHFDYLFDRDIITEDMYRDFWSEWWQSSPSEQNEMIQFYTGEEEEEPEFISENLKHPKMTISKPEAERQAKIIGGYVARRNSRGRFSKRGKFYQAIRRKRK